MRASLAGLMLVLLAATGVPASDDRAQQAGRDRASWSPIIIFGFLGGYVRPDNTLHVEVQLAARLRAEYWPSAYAEVFENHREIEAHEEILRLLDVDHNGTLSLEEKRNARIILYGHSWGGSETVELARQLEQDSIPVLLTIQVDSVMKHKKNDAVIPANVAEAANFYQTNSVLHGRPEIHAADPQRTKIIGNFRFDYKDQPIACSDDYPWLVRHFAKPHAEIECDPHVWGQVEALIRAKLPPAPARPRGPVIYQTQANGN
jgi:hypothetical protein